MTFIASKFFGYSFSVYKNNILLWAEVNQLVATVPEKKTGTVMITGANSGLGLEFATQYAAKGWTVIATHRRKTVPNSLASLASKFQNVQIETMNLINHQEIDILAKKLKQLPIDIIINNAAVKSLKNEIDLEGNASGYFGSLNYANFDIFMHTNVIGPIKVTEAFLENIKAGEEKKIINISSSAGSFSTPSALQNRPWYGVSKTALNKTMTSIVPILKESDISVVLFHPGWLQGNQPQQLLPHRIRIKDSVASMIKVIDNLTINDSGKLLNHRGQIRSW